MRDLERGLRDLGEALDYPSGEGLPRRVRARLTLEASPRRRLRRRAVLLAAVLVVALAGAAVGARFVLPGVEISPAPTPPPATPAAPGEGLGLGVRVSLEEAEAAVSFPVRIPAALGEPSAAYLHEATAGGRVSLAYRPTNDLPRDPRTGLGALLTSFRARLNREILLKKLPGEDTAVQRVTVGGSDGFWLTGEPHVVFYVGTDGEFVEDTVRMAGNVLLWEADGVTHRLEARVSLNEAIRFAESLR